MAKTFTKDHPAPILGPNFEYWLRKDLEANSSTYPIGAPLINSSGLLAEAADPLATATLVGFAMRTGQNGTSKETEWLVAFANMLIYANFLTNAGATNVLAAADKFAKYDFHQSAVHPVSDDVSGTDMYHAADVAADATLQMVSFQSDENIAGQTKTAAVAGDSDVRVIFQVLTDALLANDA